MLCLATLALLENQLTVVCLALLLWNAEFAYSYLSNKRRPLIILFGKKFQALQSY